MEGPSHDGAPASVRGAGGRRLSSGEARPPHTDVEAMKTTALLAHVGGGARER